jgi:hypothetical protein
MLGERECVNNLQCDLELEKTWLANDSELLMLEQISEYQRNKLCGSQIPADLIVTRLLTSPIVGQPALESSVIAKAVSESSIITEAMPEYSIVIQELLVCSHIINIHVVFIFLSLINLMSL